MPRKRSTNSDTDTRNDVEFGRKMYTNHEIVTQVCCVISLLDPVIRKTAF